MENGLVGFDERVYEKMRHMSEDARRDLKWIRDTNLDVHESMEKKVNNRGGLTVAGGATKVTRISPSLPKTYCKAFSSLAQISQESLICSFIFNCYLPWGPAPKRRYHPIFSKMQILIFVLLSILLVQLLLARDGCAMHTSASQKSSILSSVSESSLRNSVRFADSKEFVSGELESTRFSTSRNAYDRLLVWMHRPDHVRSLSRFRRILKYVQSELRDIDWDRMWVRCRYQPLWKEACSVLQQSEYGGRVSQEARDMAQSSMWYDRYTDQASRVTGAMLLRTHWPRDSVQPDFQLRNEPAEHDRTWLLKAIEEQDTVLAQALIVHGADLLVRDQRTGDTAVHLAVRLNLVELVRQMLQDRPVATLEALRMRNQDGKTPAMVAVAQGCAELVQLLAGNANIREPPPPSPFLANENGQSPVPRPRRRPWLRRWSSSSKSLSEE